MKTKPLLITNNDKAFAYCSPKIECSFLQEEDYISILRIARDKIHLGSRLLSHPMVNSLKPYETPYKSIVLDQIPAGPTAVYESVILIEHSLAWAEEIIRKKRLPVSLTCLVQEDFKTLDLSFIKEFVDRF